MAKYRMTPRRRAALRKAQAASARKRRRTKVKRVAAAVGAVGVLGAAGVAGHYGGRAVRQYRSRPAKPGTDLVHVQGHGKTWIFTKPKRKKKRPTYVQWEKARVRKEKARVRKNDRARLAYWKKKPVKR